MFGGSKVHNMLTCDKGEFWFPVKAAYSNFGNKVSIFQEYSKNTLIQVNILPFSEILTNYVYQNNSNLC